MLAGCDVNVCLLLCLTVSERRSAQDYGVYLWVASVWSACRQQRQIQMKSYVDLMCSTAAKFHTGNVHGRLLHSHIAAMQGPAHLILGADGGCHVP